jgi:hypothetical protein
VGQAFSLRRILIRPERDANSIFFRRQYTRPAMAALSRFSTSSFSPQAAFNRADGSSFDWQNDFRRSAI